MLGAVVMCNYLSKIKVDYEVISERKDQWKKKYMVQHFSTNTSYWFLKSFIASLVMFVLSLLTCFFLV